MAEEPLKVASIGLGWWGGELAAAAQRSGTAEVVSCFARTDTSRAEFARRFGCRAVDSLAELLDDHEIEAVIIATPHQTHREIIEAAARAGKHVFVEKPLALSTAEARRAIDAAGQADIVLQVGHHRRRQAATRALRELVEAGDIGRIHLLEGNFSRPMNLTPKDGWRGDPQELPLGGMTGMGVHMIDNLIYLAGPVGAVMAMSRPVIGVTGLDDVTVLGLEFEGGAVGYVGTSPVVPYTTQTAVFGTGGAAWSEEEGARLFRQGIDDPVRHEESIGTLDPLADQMAEFATCVRDGATPEVDGPQALQVVAVLEAAIQSQRRRAIVQLSELR